MIVCQSRSARVIYVSERGDPVGHCRRSPVLFFFRSSSLFKSRRCSHLSYNSVKSLDHSCPWISSGCLAPESKRRQEFAKSRHGRLGTECPRNKLYQGGRFIAQAALQLASAGAAGGEVCCSSRVGLVPPPPRRGKVPMPGQAFGRPSQGRHQARRWALEGWRAIAKVKLSTTSMAFFLLCMVRGMRSR